MSATTLRLESGGRRTSGAMLTSVAFHALLLLWVAFLPRLSSESPPLTEIAWIEEPGPPGEAAPAPPAAQEIAAHPQPALRRGTVHEDPTADLSLDERIGARLTALQHAPSAPLEVVGGRSLGAASLGAPATVSGPSGSGLSPLALKHGGAGPGPALELARGGGGASPAPAEVAARAIPQPPAPAAAPAGGAVAHRMLAGASLMGPVADRAILKQVIPVYPEWAKREAVEGSVTLSFVVRVDGTIKENVVVQRTAGFEDFDESARDALKAWRFEPLTGGRTGEQWGNITFRFRLRESG